MKKMLLFCILSVSLSSSATSIGGTVRNGNAEVFGTMNGAIVSIGDKAAQKLYSLLRVRAVTPSHSTSRIKTLKGTQCTKNGNKYFCQISIKTRP